MLFVSVMTFINFMIIWFMPKRLSRQEIYATLTTLAAINAATDLFLGVGNEFYDILEPGIQKQAIPIEFLLGPSFGVIFLNFMPAKWGRFAIYLITWVLISVLFELVSVHFHYITYIKWRPWYSALVYIVIFFFLRWHLHFIRRKT